MATSSDYLTPGANPAEASAFYVSAVDGPRSWLMAGPYDSYAEALADVDRVRKLCSDADPRGVWCDWGTAGFRGPRSEAPVGKANALVLPALKFAG